MTWLRVQVTSRLLASTCPLCPSTVAGVCCLRLCDRVPQDPVSNTITWWVGTNIQGYGGAGAGDVVLLSEGACSQVCPREFGPEPYTVEEEN